MVNKCVSSFFNYFEVGIFFLSLSLAHAQGSRVVHFTVLAAHIQKGYQKSKTKVDVQKRAVSFRENLKTVLMGSVEFFSPYCGYIIVLFVFVCLM
jgi:hypothetical protein